MYSLHPNAQAILEYIQKNPDMSLSEVARQLGYTRQHVSYIYRKNYELYGFGKLADRKKKNKETKKQAPKKNSKITKGKK